jgi:hypothetical protein
VGVLYVGVEEKRPFPQGIEAEIRQYIEDKTSGSSAPGS